VPISCLTVGIAWGQLLTLVGKANTLPRQIRGLAVLAVEILDFANSYRLVGRLALAGFGSEDDGFGK
jgi:hypothetical protein